MMPICIGFRSWMENVHDRKAAEKHTTEWIKDPQKFSLGDLEYALMDPLGWKKHTIELDVKRLQMSIDWLEDTINVAKKKIVKLQALLEKANERRRKHDEARTKLKPGNKIPAYLLPSEKDLRSRAMNQVKERKTLENDTMPEAALRGGWFYSSATVHRKGLRITARKQKVLSDTQLASVLKLLGIKRSKEWTSETIEIDSFGSVSVSYNQSHQRPDLNVKSVVENAMAGIRTFADSFAAGKIKKGYSTIAVVDFHARQDAIKPPIAREIDNVINLNIDAASKRRFEKVSEDDLEREVRDNIKNDPIYKANTS